MAASTQETTPLRPVSTRSVYQQRNHRTGSVWAEFWRVLLQPVDFFRHLPAMQHSRHWVWIGLLLLLLAGVSAVRYEALQNGEGGAETEDSGSENLPGDIPADPFGRPGSGPAIPLDGGFAGPPASESSSPSDSSNDWTTGLVAGATLLLGWLGLALLLSEVSLLNGKRPNLGLNLQVAIWSSVPLGIMAALQLLYYTTVDGPTGTAGVAGFLLDWEQFADQHETVQKLLWSLASRLTIFWLWSLVLLYVGGRMALRGRHLAVTLVLVLWMLVLVIAPLLLGTLEMPSQADTSVELLPDGAGDDFTDPFSSPVLEDMPPGLELPADELAPDSGGLEGPPMDEPAPDSGPSEEGASGGSTSGERRPLLPPEATAEQP